MNEKNFDYLEKQIKFTGFGEGHGEELKEKLLQQQPEFMLSHQQDFGKDHIVATLQFSKSNQNDMYFLNRYNLHLKNEQHPDAIKQTFYINNDPQKKEQDNITLKEGYNLMSGRAVQKDLLTREGQKYTAWLQLDFKETDKNGNYITKQFHENYGYDLEKALGRHPIKELADQSMKERLLESLQRGNRQSVTMQINGGEQKVLIEAVPQYKSLNFYDGQGQRINAEKLYESNGKEQSVKQQSGRENQHQGPEEDEGPGKKQEKQSKRNKQSIS